MQTQNLLFFLYLFALIPVIILKTGFYRIIHSVCFTLCLSVLVSETTYPFENDDSLLVVFVGCDVKHGASVTWHNGVLYFCIFPDVQIVGFDPSDS